MPKLNSALDDFFGEIDKCFVPFAPLYKQKELLGIIRKPLLTEAAHVRPRHWSHRGFGVGGALLAYKPSGRGPREKWGVFVGANMRTKGIDDEHSDIRKELRVCSEMITVGTARAEGYERAIAIGLVAASQEDHANGRKYPTLRPCLPCRKLLRSHPLCGLDMMVFTETSDRSDTEMLTVERLIKQMGLESESQ